MGLISSLISGFRAERIDEQKAAAIASTVTPYDVGAGYGIQPATGPYTYARQSREGYLNAELVFQCVDLRANSAGEPPVVAWQKTESGEEKIEEHPALDLLENPNAYMSRSRFWQTIMMHLDINGNAYIEKVRSNAGKVVELWLMRPDRTFVIPDRQRFIGGYRYEIGGEKFLLPPENVLHFKTRHPLDDFYGMSPLVPLADRVDLEVLARKFNKAFFNNAGVPAGMLAIQKHLNPDERRDLQRVFREQFGGETGWHRVMVMETGPNAGATYTPMGLPPGQNGAALTDVSETDEVRILGNYGVPLSLIPTLAGAKANRGQTASDAEFRAFWKMTMTAVFRDIDSTLSMGLRDEFPEFKRFEHDLSKIQALQEDEDKRVDRVIKIWQNQGSTYQEYRSDLGLPEEPDKPGVVMLLTTSVPTPSDQLIDPDAMLEAQEPPQPAPGPDNLTPEDQQQPVPANGRTNGVAH
jgi:HK97 family phage portal protein